MSCIQRTPCQPSICISKSHQPLFFAPMPCSLPIHANHLPTVSLKLVSNVSKYQQCQPVCLLGGKGKLETDNKFSVWSLQNHVHRCQHKRSIRYSNMLQNTCISLIFSCKPLGRSFRCSAAAGSGLEASITDPKDKAITFKNAKIVVESQDENRMQLRVDLTGDETQKVFDKVLTNLARTAPPVPGFRREKGGKTSKVPKSFLLQVIGEERVTKFVLQEIVNSTMADYVDRENLNVKDKKITTTQTAEELKMLFSPGNEFGFNAVMELEKSESGTLSSSSSDV